MQRSDVRVIELGQEPGLTLEPVQPLFVLRERVRQNFDGHVPTKLPVSRPIDFTRYSQIVFEAQEILIGEKKEQKAFSTMWKSGKVEKRRTMADREGSRARP